MSNCVVCNNKPKKYKCSKCLAPYCSTPCYKTHQHSCEGAPPAPPVIVNPLGEPIVKTDFLQDQSFRLTHAKLLLLKQSPEIMRMLADRTLQSILIDIDNSKQRITEVQSAMLNHRFLDFFNAVSQTLDFQAVSNDL